MKKILLLISISLFYINTLFALTITNSPGSSSVCDGDGIEVSVTYKLSSYLNTVNVKWYRLENRTPINGDVYIAIPITLKLKKYFYYYSSSNPLKIITASTSNVGDFLALVEEKNKIGVIDIDTGFYQVSLKTGVSFSTNLPSTAYYCSGGSKVLAVNNNAAYAYQWYKNSVAISGATSYSYSANSEGTYKVLATNTSTGCSGYSTSCTLISNTSDVTVTQQPTFASAVCEGTSVSLTTTATCTNGGINYQWQKSTTALGPYYADIVGATTGTYTFIPTATDHNFRIRCKISNACVPVYSNAITLSIKSKPTIPTAVTASDTILCPNSDNVTLNVSGGSLGTGDNAKWQWFEGTCTGTQFYSEALPYVTTLSSTKTLFVRGENSCGVTDCKSIKIHVKTTPVIATQPKNAERCDKDTASFFVSATGLEMQYQWQKNNANIGGANGAIYNLGTITSANNGDYRCIISNGCASQSVTSSNASLLVNADLNITTQPIDTTKVCEGTLASINVIVAGAAPITYVWKKNNVVIAGAKTNVLSFDSVLLKDTGVYHVVVTNVCNPTGDTSTTSVIKVTSQPLKPSLGADSVVCLNATATINAGAGYSSYKWNTGATTNSISVDNDSVYSVTVTNSAGCTNTASKVITLKRPYQNATICMVLVDTSQKNLVVWNKDLDKEIVKYNIYKQSNTAVYEIIGEVGIDSIGVFEDVNSDPRVKFDKYKISIVDVCGNESELSPFHRTMHLQTTDSRIGGANLSWTHYYADSSLKGFGAASYILYKGSSVGSMEIFDTVVVDEMVSNQIYTDPDTSQYYVYKVAAISPTICNPSMLKASGGPFSQSVSNLEDNRLREANAVNQILADEVKLKVYPNPVIDNINLSFTLDKIARVGVFVINSNGVIVINQNYNATQGENTLIIPASNLSTGFYYIVVKIDDEPMFIKIIKE